MATQTVLKDKSGPDWPCGLIVVATPGTPVGIMSLVDPTGVNDPSTPTPGTSGADEYSPRFQQIIFQAFKAGASSGLQNNSGNIYIVRKPVQGSGSVHNQDFGVLVTCIAAGNTFVLASGAMERNVFSPYRYFIDADNVGDSCVVTGIVQ